MCQQILRVQAAERKRDTALDALRSSEAEQRRRAENLTQADESLGLRTPLAIAPS